MIVDTGADLNVYLETGDDGERKGSCCAPAAPVSSSGGCCAPAAVVPDMTDLNEFAGE